MAKASNTVQILVYSTAAPKIAGYYISHSVTSVIADYTIEVNDEEVKGDITGGGTITLPTSTGEGSQYLISNKNADTLTIACSSSDTIDGETTQDMEQYESFIAVDDEVGNYTIH